MSIYIERFKWELDPAPIRILVRELNMRPMEEAELGYTPYRQPPTSLIRVNHVDAIGEVVLIGDDGTRMVANKADLLAELGGDSPPEPLTPEAP